MDPTRFLQLGSFDAFSGSVNQELGKMDDGESEFIHLDFPTSNCTTSRFFPTSCKSCKDGFKLQQIYTGTSDSYKII